MARVIPTGPLAPPPGRPNWVGGKDLPLLYLGWGKRDFVRDPLGLHCDHATTYYVVLRGEIVVKTEFGSRLVQGPACVVIDTECAFGLTQWTRKATEILVWIWKGKAESPRLRPSNGKVTSFDLRVGSLEPLIDLHVRCRNEVSRADTNVPRALRALHELMEVEMVRGGRAPSNSRDGLWELVNGWMRSNLSIHAPVPALCDYLRMSPSTLHRYFRSHCGTSPAVYFRRLKLLEARKLIEAHGWQVKAAAIHLGYRHANDLSRALSKSQTDDSGPIDEGVPDVADLAL